MNRMAGLSSVLRSRSEVDACVKFLVENGCVPHDTHPKNWDLAQILPEIGDGDFLDMGSFASSILSNVAVRGRPGRKVGVDLQPTSVAMPGVENIVGDLMAVPQPPGSFDYITCLSVVEHGVDFGRLAREASRLLRPGGRFFVTFDYWEPKVVSTVSMFGLPWQPLDRVAADRLAEECRLAGMRLEVPFVPELGEAVIRAGYWSPDAAASYTFGIMTFQKSGEDVRPVSPPQPPQPPTLHSYADHGADILLSQMFPDPSYKGTFVDVGAGDPFVYSNAMHFRERGWDVIALDANPRQCAKYAEKGWPILQYAACAEDKGDTVDFYVYSPSDEMSYTSLGLRYPGAPPPDRVIKVMARRLDTILAEHHPELRKIDIISVDTEGWEMEVIAGLDLAKYRPSFIVLENYLHDAGYERQMGELGYRLWRRDPLNEFYIPTIS